MNLAIDQEHILEVLEEHHTIVEQQIIKLLSSIPYSELIKDDARLSVLRKRILGVIPQCRRDKCKVIITTRVFQ